MPRESIATNITPNNNIANEVVQARRDSISKRGSVLSHANSSAVLLREADKENKGSVLDMRPKEDSSNRIENRQGDLDIEK